MAGSRPRLARVLAWAALVAVAACGAPRAESDGAAPAAFTAPGVANAPAPLLALPIVCDFGATCWVTGRFDHDSGPGFRDYACGGLGFDGNRGTAIRIADTAAMARGVAVLAAAGGRVRAARDGLADRDVREIGAAAVKRRETGNVVVIDHGGGWSTMYAHLRHGSVAVAEGDPVAGGDAIGFVGMSGLATFPALYFEVRYGGRPVDPFTGPAPPVAPPVGCGTGVAPLWSATALEALK